MMFALFTEKLLRNKEKVVNKMVRLIFTLTWTHWRLLPLSNRLLKRFQI